jgi:hypothetical protein
MGDQAAMARFGWQGIELDAPKPWDLSAYHGGADAGYAVLDDGLQMRLQVRWNRREKHPVPLDQTVDRYERSLQKKSKGQACFERLSPQFLPARFHRAHTTAPFYWEGQQCAYGMAWQCLSCRCMGLAEVLFAPSEADRGLAWKILTSLSDHREDGQRLWSVYDFAFRTPSAYNLERSDLTPGRLLFEFRAGRGGRLTVERWSVAAEWLRKTPLDQWPGELLRRGNKTAGIPHEQGPIVVHGCPGWRFGRPGGRRRLVRYEPVEGLVWHCAERDKVYAVMAQGGEDGVAPAIAATVDGA